MENGNCLAIPIQLWDISHLIWRIFLTFLVSMDADNWIVEARFLLELSPKSRFSGGGGGGGGTLEIFERVCLPWHQKSIWC